MWALLITKTIFNKLLVPFHMQMIGHKVLLKTIRPYAPLKLQVIIKIVVLFWLLDITYLCLHHNYICFHILSKPKKNQNWWFFDFWNLLKKNLEPWIITKSNKSRYPHTHTPNKLFVQTPWNWENKLAIHDSCA